MAFKVTLDPSQKEVVLHSLWPFKTPSDLARMVIAASSQLMVPRLYWCNGVLFVKTVPTHLLTTETGAKEFLGGKIHYNVAYTFMEKFEPVVRLDGREIHVMNSSGLEEDKAISRWITENAKGRT
ncbi:MAG: hypothetical protein GTN80_04160 [Nitrososphaeria archaeon]|nr:hypothetical protein [Nitrososphaeria archaeon]NIN52345.1 hypothetical protein [Nitrososphaeria archaeon]NIQ32823.1 hypothetical protein [Nitrososphaeria archaeon]